MAPKIVISEGKRRQLVDMLLEYRNRPRSALFEYPYRDDDSYEYIRKAETALDKLLDSLKSEVAQSQPTMVNTIEELCALPADVVLRAADGPVLIVQDGSFCYRDGGIVVKRKASRHLPARIIDTPRRTANV